jgi:hypothetical protein
VSIVLQVEPDCRALLYFFFFFFFFFETTALFLLDPKKKRKRRLTERFMSISFQACCLLPSNQSMAVKLEHFARIDRLLEGPPCVGVSG